MATQVLVSGSGGNIGRRIRSIAQHEILYLNNSVDLLEGTGPAEFVNHANRTGCKSILHLAWSANTSMEYLHESTQKRWVDSTL